MLCMHRAWTPHTQEYTAAHPVETRLPLLVGTHFLLRTIGNTILPTVRSGGNFWFIQCNSASCKAAVNVGPSAKANLLEERGDTVFVLPNS